VVVQLLDGDHRLNAVLPQVESIFDELLKQTVAAATTSSFDKKGE
jgi:hypothetical protein